MDTVEPPPSDTGLKCPKCGYNLTALTTRTCPECGETFVITDVTGHVRPPPPSALRHVAGALYGLGTVLVVMSWFRMVDNKIGWVGFGVAMSGWLISHAVKR